MMMLWKSHVKRSGFPHWFILWSIKTHEFTLVHTWNGSEIYWWYGPGHCTLDLREWRVAWYLGRFDQDDAQLDRVAELIDYHQPLKEFDGVELREGFISPEGRYFICGYGQHTSTADTLIARFFPDKYYDPERSEQKLENLGWVNVRYSLATCFQPLRQVQKQFILHLIDTFPKDNMFVVGLCQLLRLIDDEEDESDG